MKKTSPIKNSYGKSLTIDQALSALGFAPMGEDLHVLNKYVAKGTIPMHVPHRLDHYCMILVTAGSCEFKINMVPRKQDKNDLLIILPQAINQFVSVSDDYEAKIVAFNTNFPFKLGVNLHHANTFTFFLMNEPSQLVSLNEEEAGFISSAFDLLYKKNTLVAHIFKKELILHAFSLLMFEVSAVFKHHSRLSVKQLSRQEDYSLRFLKLLTGNIKSERGIKFYADLLGVSTDYLSRITQRTLQQPASVLIDEFVIQESKVLLQQSSFSVAQIASQLSFSDPFQFSKFFKRKTGMPPTAYRNIEL